MLTTHSVHIRMFLHLLGASVWLGGIVTLGGSKGQGRMHKFVWPAFLLLLITGAWSILDRAPGASSPYLVTLAVKLAAVVVSGAGLGFAAMAHSRTVKSVWTTVALVSAVASMYLGVLLHG